MKTVLERLLLAAAITLMAVALDSSAPAQQADEDPNPASSRRQQSVPQHADAGQVPAGEVRTQDALAFTGQVEKEKDRVVLVDPVTKINYQLDDQSKAQSYIGRQVKIIGKLDMNSNTIRIESIERLR